MNKIELSCTIPALMPTQHALLIAWGYFGQEIGLLERLATVPIDQKSIIHYPYEKLTEFLCGLLSGIEYLSDLSEGSSPLAQDNEVALAWQIRSMSDSSGVSRTLAACDLESERVLQDVLDEVSQPFFDRALADLRARGESLLLDADLTGRAVSSTSKSYTDARFGYMDGEIRLGYQLAEVCLQTHLFGRLWVCGQHHPGDRVSATCLLDLVQTAEQRLGCHPRRRTELIQQRITACEQAIARLERLSAQCETRQQEAQARIQNLTDRITQAQVQLADLLAQPVSNRQEGSYSRLSKLKHQIASWQGQVCRAQRVIIQAQKAQLSHQQRLAVWYTQRTDLQARYEHLCQENTSPQQLVGCKMRLDAGFSSGENITALIELGYDLDTKSGNDALVQALRDQTNAQTVWTRVGRNAEMVARTVYHINTCPYPLTVGLERFHTPKETRHAVLIRYQDPPQDPPADDHLDLPAWFHDYNGRQTIEAGNKEEKTVFKVQHLMTRSPSGIRIQAMLTIFAANLVRWADEWLRPRVEQSSARFDRALSSPKRLVRVAANSPAFVDRSGDALRIRFSPLSSFPGVVLCLSDQPFLQLELPLFRNAPFSSA